jgi:hypothetical protein
LESQLFGNLGGAALNPQRLQACAVKLRSGHYI